MFNFCFFLVSLLAVSPASAVLNIEVTGAGDRQIGIALLPFAGDTPFTQSINEVVANDLARTGLFKLLNPSPKTPHEVREVDYADWLPAEALTLGSLTKLANGNLELRFRLLDTMRKTELFGQIVSAKSDQWRAIGHRVADLIYERLTGNHGVFSTRIAYVNRQGKINRLVVADSDGFGEITILEKAQPIMSPSWSPDGKSLAYVSFEQGRAMIYTQSLASKQRHLLASFPGSNSAPAWSPDGKSLAIVLNQDGSSQIHLIKADGSALQRISFSGGIDTEPTFSPDGKTLLFSSDRGGSVQIYQMSSQGGSAERLTFEGTQNFSPRFNPDGKSFTFAHYKNGQFYIANQDFETKQIQLLTGGGWHKKPSFAPNGKLVLFANEAQGRGILETVSSDGRVKQRMTPQQGDIREPTWGPYPR